MTRARIAPFAPFVVAALLAAGGIVACGGSSPPVAQENGNHTFFQDDQPGAGPSRFERPYPPLDAKDFVGVAVLDGTVRFSRPKSWKIRRASLEAGKRFIEYVSPEAYLFAIYERLDAAGDDWSDVVGRYEEDAKDAGAEWTLGSVPVASEHAQGRAYVIHRKVHGTRGTYTNTSEETVYRGSDHVELVEIVHQGDATTAIAPTLLHVTDTLDVR